MPRFTPAKASVSAGLRLASSALSAAGRLGSLTAAVIAAGTAWAARTVVEVKSDAATTAARSGRAMALPLWFFRGDSHTDSSGLAGYQQAVKNAWSKFGAVIAICKPTRRERSEPMTVVSWIDKR